jgi:PAS domain S-box-containing protein
MSYLNDDELKLLSSALDQHSIVSTLDVNGNITQVNDKFCETYQYSRDEIIGQHYRIVESKKYNNNYFEELWVNLARGETWHDEILSLAKDGSEYWVDSTIVPFLNKRGMSYKYLIIRNDITHLKKLELSHESEHEAALMRAKVAQILHEQTSLKDRIKKILEVLAKFKGLELQNKLGVFLLEEGANELEMFVTHGKYSDEFLHSEQCVKIGSCLCGRAAVSGLLKISDDCMTDTEHDHTFEDMTPHGHYIIPLKYSDDVLGILFMYTDPYPSREPARLDILNFIGEMIGLAIANERVQEELRRAKRNAEDTARVKSEFLANMSHEIRTPMNGVLGMLELLSDRKLDEKSKNFVDVAQGSANLLLTVINDILDVSKIESGKFHIEKIDIDIRTLLEETVSLHANNAHQKQLDISCLISNDIKEQVRCDEMRLRQILNNLIGNAIKFTSAGEVLLKVSTVKASDLKQTLRFEITDTGIGVDSDKQKILFEAFSQADTSTSRKFGGTGLGLAISIHLVEMMGGEMGVISALNQGSTFWFELPFEILEKQNKSPTQLNNINVLIVDDNETNCLVLEQHLENWGLQYRSETRPELILDILQQAYKTGSPYELLLLDMQMPLLDGAELAKNIRNNKELNDLKIILLTSLGIDDLQETDNLFELSLTKPIHKSLLCNAISTVMGQTQINNENKIIIPGTEKRLKGSVLYAEDNQVNRMIGQEIISRMGLQCKIVNNGLQALEISNSGKFDLILMDCQMPVMDGFEATKKIRLREQNKDRKREVIVALTANAMAGDREACLAVGMNDYLAKPFTFEMLFSTLSQWLPTEESNIIKETSIVTDESVDADNDDVLLNKAMEVIDAGKFEELNTVMGEQINLIVDAFIDTGNTNIKSMELSLKDADFKLLREQIHALKGGCGHIGAQQLYQVCAVAEENCRSGETQNIDELVGEIISLFDKSQNNLKALVNET